MALPDAEKTEHPDPAGLQKQDIAVCLLFPDHREHRDHQNKPFQYRLINQGNLKKDRVAAQKLQEG